MYEGYIMVINFYIYIKNTNSKTNYACFLYFIVNYSYSYAYSLFVNMFHVRNSW